MASLSEGRPFRRRLNITTPTELSFLKTVVDVGVSAVTKNSLEILGGQGPKKSTSPGLGFWQSRGPQGGVKFRSHLWEHEMGNHNGCPSCASDLGPEYDL